MAQKRPFCPGHAAESEPVLSQITAAAVTGLPPAGPELRRRPKEITLRGRPGVVVTAPLARKHGVDPAAIGAERVQRRADDRILARQQRRPRPHELAHGPTARDEPHVEVLARFGHHVLANRREEVALGARERVLGDGDP